MNRATSHPVIALITEWQDAAHGAQQRDESSGKGASMRLGAQEVLLGAGTRARDIYNKDAIMERHRHRYEFNNNYLERYSRAGMRFSGFSRDGLVEIIELPTHPWFVATQFHPEFTSTPRDGHPLFTGFIRAARAHRSRAVAASRRSMKLAGQEVGVDRPFFLIAGPCVIESANAHPGDRRAPQRDHHAPQDRLCLQGLFRQG
jgi:CTP synthase